LAQRQATVTRVAVDHSQNASRQLQQPPEVKDGRFVWDALQTQPRKLAKDRGLVQRLLHGRVVIAKPVVLQQMYAQHRHQRVGRTATFTLGVIAIEYLEALLYDEPRVPSIPNQSTATGDAAALGLDPLWEARELRAQGVAAVAVKGARRQRG
jgi:hypothetical protein|tara:strand:- start:4508 stop:4966 length:459 start_codon:yes stop_codon:yes gene_type:complete